MINPDGTKTCRKCGIAKPLSEFHKHNNIKDKYFTNCKECQNNVSRENRAKRKKQTRKPSFPNFKLIKKISYHMNEEQVKNIVNKSLSLIEENTLIATEAKYMNFYGRDGMGWHVKLVCKKCGCNMVYGSRCTNIINFASIYEMRARGVKRCACNGGQVKTTEHMYVLANKLLKSGSLRLKLKEEQEWNGSDSKYKWIVEIDEIYEGNAIGFEIERIWGDVINHGQDKFRIQTYDEGYKLFNMVFGNELELIISEEEKEKFSTQNKYTFKCNKCGEEWETTFTNKILNGTKCPYCYRSRMEEEGLEFSQKYKLNYKEQQILDGCKDKGNLIFDGEFFNKEGTLMLAIEYNGEHHFMPISYNSKIGNEKAIIRYNDRIKKDNIKAMYCIDNNIPLAIVPYWEKGNVEKYLLNYPDEKIRNIIHQLIEESKGQSSNIIEHESGQFVFSF